MKGSYFGVVLEVKSASKSAPQKLCLNKNFYLTVSGTYGGCRSKVLKICMLLSKLSPAVKILCTCRTYIQYQIRWNAYKYYLTWFKNTTPIADR